MIQLAFLFLPLVQRLQAYYLPRGISENTLNHTVVPSKQHFSPLNFKALQAMSKLFYVCRVLLHHCAEHFFNITPSRDCRGDL